MVKLFNFCTIGVLMDYRVFLFWPTLIGTPANSTGCDHFPDSNICPSDRQLQRRCPHIWTDLDPPDLETIHVRPAWPWLWGCELPNVRNRSPAKPKQVSNMQLGVRSQDREAGTWPGCTSSPRRRMYAPTMALLLWLQPWFSLRYVNVLEEKFIPL
jgi:hypothetical protein